MKLGERQRCLSLFFCIKVWWGAEDVLSLSNIKTKIMADIFSKFLDDEYQSKEYQERERKHKPFKTTRIEYGSKSYKILNSLIHFDEVEPMVNKIFKNE